MGCKFALFRVLREWNGAETHRCTCKKKKKIPSKQKRTEKTEESWEGGGKKSQRKPFREWEELHTLS
jgi:hypothetical protein